MELTDDIRNAIHKQLTSAPKQKSNVVARTYRFNNGHSYASDALGVHPSQVKEASKALRAQGVCVDFTEDGRAIIESEKQYRDIGRATGMWNGRDGWEPTNYNGKQIATGRNPVERRREARRMLQQWCREGT